jgi:hypothetical protein
MTIIANRDKQRPSIRVFCKIVYVSGCLTTFISPLSAFFIISKNPALPSLHTYSLLHLHTKQVLIMAFQFSLIHLVAADTVAAFLLSKTTIYTLTNLLPWIYLATIPSYLVIYKSYIYPFYISELRHVPTVPTFPLWGQFFDIIFQECGVPQRKWHQEHGPIIRYFFPFGAERLSIADDKAIHQMTVKNPYNYPKPVRAKLWMVRILGDGVLLAEGSEHVHQRKALAPGFSISSIRALSPVFWSKALLLSKLWGEEMAASRVRTNASKFSSG